MCTIALIYSTKYAKQISLRKKKKSLEHESTVRVKHSIVLLVLHYKIMQ